MSIPTPIILQPRHLRGVISIDAAVAVVRRAHLDWARDHSLNAACHRIHTPNDVRLCAHPGVLPGSVAGLLVHCERLDETEGRQRFTTSDPPVSVVYDAVTGRLRGILIGEPTCRELPDVSSVAGLRTAATSVLGTLALARPDADTIAIIGSGKQARLHLVALHRQRPMRRVRVFSRDPENRNRFAAQMSALLATEVAPAESVASAVADSDIVLTATNSMGPVVDGGLLEAGQHITSIVGGVQGPESPGPRRGELDAIADERASIIGMASVVQARLGFAPLAEAPAPPGGSATDAYPHWSKTAELHDLVAGNHPGRLEPESITIFKNNAGQGIADIAVAGAVLDHALGEGLGTTLSLA